MKERAQFFIAMVATYICIGLAMVLIKSGIPVVGPVVVEQSKLDDLESAVVRLNDRVDMLYELVRSKQK